MKFRSGNEVPPARHHLHQCAPKTISSLDLFRNLNNPPPHHHHQRTPDELAKRRAPDMATAQFPKFGLFYFPDSHSVRVESTDIIVQHHRDISNQITNRLQLLNPDLHYIEVCLPSRSRHGDSTQLAAKLLLLGGK